MAAISISLRAGLWMSKEEVFNVFSDFLPWTGYMFPGTTISPQIAWEEGASCLSAAPSWALQHRAPLPRACQWANPRRRVGSWHTCRWSGCRWFARVSDDNHGHCGRVGSLAERHQTEKFFWSHTDKSCPSRAGKVILNECEHLLQE